LARMLIVERTVVRRMRFHECDDQNERIALMFFDKLACMFFQKFWPRQFKRQIADSQFRESSILLVGRNAFCNEEICVVAVIVSRKPLVKSASSGSFLAEVPLAHVCGAIVFVFH